MKFVDICKEKWFFWKYNLVKPGATAYFAKMKADQYRSPEEIEALNWERTQKILHYAWEHVPYYRKRFEAEGMTPDDIRTPEDFEKVPLLTRKDLTENFSKLLSDEATLRDVRISTTGGSSGTPAKVYHQKSVVRAAAGWRMLDWWNISPAANWASVYRDVCPTFKAKVIHFLEWFPTWQLLLNATSFTERDMLVFLRQFQKRRPQLLHGYVGAIDVLAQYMLDHGISVPAPKAIWVTSAPITPVQQNRIEKAFGAPVYDQYGCCEMYWLAAECAARRGLHMFYDIRRFEFLDENHHRVPDGEYGDIVITDLENYYFPLIRYVNGDRGRRLPGVCSCGCNLPLMDKVKGRVSESFVLPSGTRLNGEFLTTIFDSCPEVVKQFQVHQRKDRSIEILVVPSDSPLREKVFQEVCEDLRKKCNHEVPVELKEVAEIPLRKGKLKYIISDAD